MRPLSNRNSWVPWLFLAIAVGLQVQAGLTLLSSDLLSADPPAHFATGVLVHDFLRNSNGQGPVPFAKCFYVRFPKVAFGHWPPVFYILEAAWFFIFGTKVAAARCLCALIAAWCAFLIYRRCAVSWGKWQALMAAAAFLAWPAVRHQAWTVMTDLLLMGFMFLALGSLSDYLTSENPRHLLWLTIWTSLAILTKGSAWLLFAPIVGGPLVSGRPRTYFRWTYWLALLGACAISAPFFIYVSSLHLSYSLSITGYIQGLLATLSHWSLPLRAAAIALPLIVVFAAFRFLPRKALRPAATMIAILGLWAATLAAFITAFPVTPEVGRFFLVLLAPAAYVVAGIMTWLESRFDSIRPPHGRLLPALAYGLIFIALFPIQFVHTSVFSRSTSAIPISPVGPVILVESDARGEGAIIAARLESDPNRGSYFVRGSQFLAHSSWSGYNYAAKYTTPEALRAALQTIDPDYLILDTSAPPTLDSILLGQVLRESESHWAVLGRYPVTVASRPGDLVVYRREPTRSSPRPVPNSVQLGDERGFQTLTCPVR